MKVKVPTDLSNLTAEDPTFIANISQLLSSMVQILNGKVNFIENCQVKIITATFNAANTQQGFQHGLNKLPSGFIIVGSKVSVNVYNGSTANSLQVIYLQATVATAVNLMIF